MWAPFLAVAMNQLPVPTPRQMEWHQTELYTLIHFGPNTFTGKEWGHGDEDPKIFNPKEFNPRQWAKAIKAGGFKGLVMVAKHHDGFCLWPSRFSPHTVKESAWKDGKGDVIREVMEACRAEGLKFGVYLSPWDRRHPYYGTGEKYNEAYRRQMVELLTGYGPLFMFWFDGANGEGPNGKKQVYDWPSFWSLVREHQPGASMFSDVGPDVRWVGNEEGHAGEPCWNTYSLGSLLPGNSEAPRLNPKGDPSGETWLPAECDVPLRPGWFWRQSEDEKVKPLSWMVDTYFASVGRGASLNLGLAPDSRGLLHENDVTRLKEFGAWLKESFDDDILSKSNLPSELKDGSHSTFVEGSTVEALLPTPEPANVVLIQEHIQGGQRIRAYTVEVKDENGAWKEVARLSSLGWKRLIRFPEQKVSGVRLKIQESVGTAQISKLALYKAVQVSAPSQ